MGGEPGPAAIGLTVRDSGRRRRRSSTSPAIEALDEAVCARGSPRATACSPTAPSSATTTSSRSASAQRDSWAMGHAPLSGEGGTLEALAALDARIDPRPHQQHQPDPARGFARARRVEQSRPRSLLRRHGDRPMSTTPPADRGRRAALDRGGVRRGAARAGRALPRPAPLPRADERGRALARGAAALGRQPLLLPARASRSRTRRSSPTAPSAEVRREWIQRIIDHDGAEGEARRDRVLAAARRVARGRPRRRSASERLVLPGVRYSVDAYVNFCRTRTVGRARSRRSLTELFGPGAIKVARSRRSRSTTRGSTRPGSSTSARACTWPRATPSTRSTWCSSAAAPATTRNGRSPRSPSSATCSGRSSTRSTAATRGPAPSADAMPR